MLSAGETVPLSSLKVPQIEPDTRSYLDTYKFPNMLSEFIYVRTYSRWLEGKARREFYPETVRRYVSYIFRGKNVPLELIKECEDAILSLDVMPSMRALWAAGPAMERDNTTAYNCSFLPIDNLRAFAEVLYILMQGTGVGFSVERTFVNNLPLVSFPTNNPPITHVIEDSTEGWADALYVAITEAHKGNRVRFDYSNIRPKGARLKVKGGRASGPMPLRRVLNFIQETIVKAAGRRLKPIEAHDIICMEAEIVMVGGFRRASLISFSDLDDEEMRHAKDFSKGDFPKIRYMANNSVYYEGRPTEEQFWNEWQSLVQSGSGERGFYIASRESIKKRGGHSFRANPCGEIKLRFLRAQDPWTGAGGAGQFCNLSAAVMRSTDTIHTMAQKIRLATWLGCVQSTYTSFPYLRKGWETLCEEDRLIGVDITGQCDNPKLSTDPEAMWYFNRIARDTAEFASQALGINQPVAITCGKPSGNSSQFLDCASGFHPRYAHYYFRHVRISSKDPLFHLIKDQGVPLFKENNQENLPDDQVDVWVARFPMKAPDGAMTRTDETAIQECERYLHIMRTWCGEKGHNQSATIYVREEEWEDLGKWVWEHFDEITGLTFLPFDKGTYRLMPYEEITEEEYEEAMGSFPKINFSLLSQYEADDNTEGAQSFACTSGACEI